MAALLLIEDEPTVRHDLTRALRSFGHTVRTAPDAPGAIRHLTAHPPDLVLLRLGRPDLDGADALSMIRGACRDVPVIVVSDRSRDADVVRLLHAGADDYLARPFSGEHLHARVTAVLRRAGPRPPSPPSEMVTVGELTIDRRRRQVRLGGCELTLTRREFDLLAYLCTRPGQVVTRRELLAEVWQDASARKQVIDVQLSLLRRKLGETATAPRYLFTVRGVGVRLRAPAPRSTGP